VSTNDHGSDNWDPGFGPLVADARRAMAEVRGLPFTQSDLSKLLGTEISRHRIGRIERAETPAGDLASTLISFIVNNLGPNAFVVLQAPEGDIARAETDPKNSIEAVLAVLKELDGRVERLEEGANIRRASDAGQREISLEKENADLRIQVETLASRIQHLLAAVSSLKDALGDNI
jgi:hypothetical protein